MVPQGLLVARQPNAGTAIAALAFDLHPVQFVLQGLSVLLNLLGLLEGFGELAKIGESEPCHGDPVGAGRLSRRSESQPLHFGVQTDSVFGLDAVLHQVDQLGDVLRLGITGVDDEIGMHG